MARKSQLREMIEQYLVSDRDDWYEIPVGPDNIKRVYWLVQQIKYKKYKDMQIKKDYFVIGPDVYDVIMIHK